MDNEIFSCWLRLLLGWLYLQFKVVFECWNKNYNGTRKVKQPVVCFGCFMCSIWYNSFYNA